MKPKSNQLSSISRIITGLCGIALVIVLFVPLWNIYLIAPQYPEGLVLTIEPSGLAGNVDIINGLNHYIGMKTLHNEDFIEFRILPYIIGAFAALFLLAALIGKKRFFTAVVISYVLFGIIAMVDFYRWEYDYGHDLDPNAAIKVPGMAYQPPLIGYKQLLNFSAYSIPAAGGWIFISAGLALVALWIIEARRKKIIPVKNTTIRQSSLVLMSLLLFSCTTGPEPIHFSKDDCTSCKMTISDTHFGAVLMSKKGRAYKFDDTFCLVAFLRSGKVATADVSAAYLVNFNDRKQLLEVNNAFLVASESFKSPMGGNIAAFATATEQSKAIQQTGGKAVKWSEITK